MSSHSCSVDCSGLAGTRSFFPLCFRERKGKPVQPVRAGLCGCIYPGHPLCRPRTGCGSTCPRPVREEATLSAPAACSLVSGRFQRGQVAPWNPRRSPRGTVNRVTQGGNLSAQGGTCPRGAAASAAAFSLVVIHFWASRRRSSAPVTKGEPAREELNLSARRPTYPRATRAKAPSQGTVGAPARTGGQVGQVSPYPRCHVQCCVGAYVRGRAGRAVTSSAGPRESSVATDARCAIRGRALYSLLRTQSTPDGAPEAAIGNSSPALRAYVLVIGGRFVLPAMRSASEDGRSATHPSPPATAERGTGMRW